MTDTDLSGKAPAVSSCCQCCCGWGRRMALGVAVILLLDQATKWVALQTLRGNPPVTLTSFFSLTYVQNTGAAFGIFPGGNLFFIIVAVAVLILLAVFHRQFLLQGRWARWGLTLLWGGALGNLIDRIIRGSVIDFIDVYWKDWHWPAFNVADSAICVGTALLMIAGFFPQRTNPTEAGEGGDSPGDPSKTGS